MYCIISWDKDGLNRVIEAFNTKYVKISDTEWMVYGRYNIYRMILLYAEPFKKYVF